MKPGFVCLHPSLKPVFLISLYWERDHMTNEAASAHLWFSPSGFNPSWINAIFIIIVWPDNLFKNDTT